MSKKREAQTKTLMLALENTEKHVNVEWNVGDKKRGSGDSDDEFRYRVALSDLTESASAVRDRLAALEACDWSDSEEANDRRILRLRKLAEAGADLYEALMRGAPEHRPSVRAAKNFRDWFEKTVLDSQDEWRIQVVHGQYDAPVVPWGLVFRPRKDGKYKSLGDSVEEYEDFWALRFKLACRGSMRHEADRNYNKMSHIHARLALTINVEDDVLQRYGKDSAGEKKYAEHRVSTTVETFEKFPRASGTFDIYWYIFLNESGPGYRLANKEIDVSLIERVRDKTQRIMIMFMDGNAVIQGKRGVKWVQTMLDMGRTGLIAAETDIKNDQLSHCGWDLWKSILKTEKLPLIDAIDEARRRYWPKSLLYGVYCDPVKIFYDPPPDEEIEVADDFLEFVLNKVGKKAGGQG